MWTCPFHPPVQLYFIIRNVERSPDFNISRIKIWNYNHSINVSTAESTNTQSRTIKHWNRKQEQHVLQSKRLIQSLSARMFADILHLENTWSSGSQLVFISSAILCLSLSSVSNVLFSFCHIWSTLFC